MQPFTAAFGAAPSDNSKPTARSMSPKVPIKGKTGKTVRALALSMEMADAREEADGDAELSSSKGRKTPSAESVPPPAAPSAPAPSD